MSVLFSSFTGPYYNCKCQDGSGVVSVDKTRLCCDLFGVLGSQGEVYAYPGENNQVGNSC